ncbi:MAG: ATP-binding protein, partial [Verrucomicrobiia bacterium]
MIQVAEPLPPQPSSDRYAGGESIDWADLIDSQATLPAAMDLERVQNFFRDHPTIAFAAVLDGSRIVGLCSELTITRKLTVSRGLGYCVFAKTPLSRHVQEACLVIRRGDPVLDVLGQVMHRKVGFFDDIILTDEQGRFLGLIQTQTMMRLQHRITAIQLNALESLTSQLNTNNAELARARDAAMEAASMKASFLANMSHEIRTPLNGILGMVRILMRTQLDPTQRRYASTVLNSANALLTILNDILDFSKIEAGRMEFEKIPFNLADLIEEAVQLNAERAREKKIDIYSWIDPNDSTAFISDPTRLRQILLNLVSNAVKFTESGEVVVRLETLHQTPTEATIRISVRDTGVGIAPDVQQRLFSAFEQGDRSTSRKFGGTGLGLAISKRLTELLGGSIGCQSQLGQGSTFHIELTLPKDPAASLPGQPKHEELWGVRVLIVDDSTSFCSYLSQHLSRWQVITRTATSAQEAAELARRQAERNLPFDACLIDFHLSGQDGLQLAHALASDPLTASSRHVLLAAFEQEISLDAARNAHVAAVLAKPVKPSELLEGLLKALRSRPSPQTASLPLLTP